MNGRPAFPLVAAVALGALVALGSGCGGGSSTSADAVDTTAAAPDLAGGVTYHVAARAVFARNCTVCHTEGGIGPFPLDDYASASGLAPAAVSAVEAGRMPPWTPSPECRSYQAERIVSADDKATLRAWLDAGTPEGDPATYVPPDEIPGASRGEPDLVLGASEPYPPNTASGDDYHCFPLAHDFTEETWISDLQVVPGNGDTVHHVLVFLVAASQVPALDELDAADPGVGYTCFGGTGTGVPQTIGGWVPGGQAPVLPDDTAYRVSPGDRLVLQVHYSLLTSQEPDPGTKLQLWLRETKPDFLLVMEAVAHLALEVEAGDADSHQVKRWWSTSRETLEILGVAPHMHLLGTSIGVHAKRADGSEDCLVQIDEWAFNWQQAFVFLPGEALILHPDDELELTCVYDNSAANQPIVDGEPLEPTRVTWGDSTLDEMCIAYLMVRRPYAEPESFLDSCGDFDACYDACRAGGGFVMTCTIECGTEGPEPEPCTECVIESIAGCTSSVCPTALGKMIDCALDCEQAEDPDACLLAECLEALAGFEQCVQPLADPGGCDGEAASCGVSLQTGP